MTNDLFTYADGMLPHQGGTSKEAAASGLRQAKWLSTRVRLAFEDAAISGLTDEELIRGFRDISARPRRIGLMHQRIVRDSGERRKTEAGRSAVVWKLAKYVE